MELYFMIEVVAQDGVFEFPPLPPPLFSQGFIDGLGGWCFLVAVGAPFLGGLLGWHGQRCVVFGWLMLVAACGFWEALGPGLMEIWHGADAATAITPDQSGMLVAMLAGGVIAGILYAAATMLRDLIRWIARKPIDLDTIDTGRRKALKWLATVAIPPLIVAAAAVVMPMAGEEWAKSPDVYTMEEDGVNALEAIRMREGRFPVDLRELSSVAYRMAETGILESDSSWEREWSLRLRFYELKDEGRYRLELRGSPRRILGEPGRVVIEPR